MVPVAPVTSMDGATFVECGIVPMVNLPFVRAAVALRRGLVVIVVAITVVCANVVDEGFRVRNAARGIGARLCRRAIRAGVRAGSDVAERDGAICDRSIGGELDWGLADLNGLGMAC